MNSKFHIGLANDRGQADPDNDSDRIDLRGLAQSLWRRRRMIAVSTAAGMFLAFALVLLTTPIYSARATVMLDGRNLQLVSSNDPSADVTLNNPLLDTEAAVLRSNVLLDLVVRSIPPEAIAPLAPGAAAIEDPELRAQRLVGALRQALTIWREGQSYAISISVDTPDPELSALLANTIASTYIESQVTERSDAVSSTTRFLEARVEELARQVELAEAAVEEFKVRQFVSDGMTVETMTQQLVELGTQLALARADLATVKAKWEPVQKTLDEKGVDAAAELVTSPYVLSLRQQLADAQRSDADLATQLGPEHPDRQRLRATIELLRNDLTEEVRKVVASLHNDVLVGENRTASLQASVSELEARVAEVSKSSLELRQLEREAEALRGGYQAMLERLNEAQTLEQYRLANARVIEKATVPSLPSEPRTNLLLALGAVGGMTAALLAALFMELSNTGFSRTAQLEDATGLPVIGFLPRGRWANLADAVRRWRRDPYQGFTEQIRNLRTSLALRHSEGPMRTILITSSVPGEGKTTTALGLAQIEARAKRSVVLVDFDTRRTNLATTFGYAPPNGDLAALVRGQCSLDEALHQPDDLQFPLLSTRVRDPRLLDETSLEQIQVLFDQLKERFQTIVIDSPPLLVVSDSLSISRLADVTLVLVRQNETRRRAVREALRRLGDMGTRPDGLVMTLVDPRDVSATYGVMESYE